MKSGITTIGTVLAMVAALALGPVGSAWATSNGHIVKAHSSKSHKKKHSTKKHHGSKKKSSKKEAAPAGDKTDTSAPAKN
jgi:hypothetical protein